MTQIGCVSLDKKQIENELRNFSFEGEFPAEELLYRLTVRMKECVSVHNSVFLYEMEHYVLLLPSIIFSKNISLLFDIMIQIDAPTQGSWVK